MKEFILKTDKPIYKATAQLAERFGRILPNKMKEDPLRIILTGGVAVSLYSEPRVSNDVDAILSHRVLPPQDTVVSYTDRNGESKVLSWDSNYNSSLGLLHPDAETDAIFIASLAEKKVKLMVLTPTDLAVTKIGRFYDPDREDIISLAKEGLLKAEAVKKRTEEALDYYVGDDRFVKINIKEAVEYIQKYGKTTITLAVEEGKKSYFVKLKPVVAAGLNVFGQKTKRYIIGIYPSQNAVYYKYSNIFNSFYSSLKEIWFIIYITMISLFYLIAGKLPASDLGGPIMIAQLSGRAASMGVSDFFYFIAFISVNIGLINLFPIPALDGGHLLFSIIEMIKRKPLSVKFQETAAKVGFALLILLLLFVSYNDIIRTIKT